MTESPPMRDRLPDEASSRLPNMGPLDAAVRVVLAPLVPLLLGLLLSTWHRDWIFTLVIHGLVLTAYLALTAVVRIDPLYEALGWSTSRGVARRRSRGSGRAAG